MYDVSKGPNGSLIIDVLVPGHSKEDLECTFENGYLNISSKLPEAALETYIRKGIKEFRHDLTLSLGTDMKVDMVTLDRGILRILCSKVLSPVGTKLVIQ